MPFSHTGAGYPAKRLLDVLGASALTVTFSPVIVGVACLILKEAGAPVIYQHERVGLNGKPFKVLKFRTMVRDADVVLKKLLAESESARQEWAATHKLKNDPRVTAIGRFLRKTSLDELPQLLNVLKGEMSLVGPRPIVADELAHYGEHSGSYLSARPGLTGPWQVSGRNDVSYAERVKLDVEYIAQPSVAKDVEVLLRTIAVVLFRRGAY